MQSTKSVVEGLHKEFELKNVEFDSKSGTESDITEEEEEEQKQFSDLQSQLSDFDLPDTESDETILPQRKFVLKMSIFVSWKLNLQKHFAKCFEADMKYSKIYKFVKKPEDLENVKEILLDNYEKIYEQYVYAQSLSNYPSISMTPFTKMCRLWGVIGKDLEVKDIDRVFCAVNYQEVNGVHMKNPTNNDNELVRFEFFEAIVRMAFLKYESSGLKSTCAEATQKMLDEHIFQNIITPGWHSCRKKEIWLPETHDVILANKEVLEQFVKWWLQTHSNLRSRSQLFLDDIQSIFSKKLSDDHEEMKKSCNITDQDILQAFSFSKFPLVDEIGSYRCLCQLKIDQFYEFLIRIALAAQLPDEVNFHSRQSQDENAGGRTADKLFRIIKLLVNLNTDKQTRLTAIDVRLQEDADN